MSGWEDHKIGGFSREHSAAFLRYKLNSYEKLRPLAMFDSLLFTRFAEF